MTVRQIIRLGICLAGLCCGPVSASETRAPEVELLHWWISPGEQAALQEIGKRVVQEGGVFNAIPMPNYASLRADVLKRLALGYPPAVVQWLGGRNIAELSNLKIIQSLPENGQEKPLRELLFPEVLGEVVQGETLVALPVVLHIQNTAFYNASIYRELGLEPPASWQAFIRQARHISAAGFTPLALSAEAWQLRMLFNDILLEVLGAEGFRRFYDETRAIASQRQALRTALDYFLQLRHFVDDPKQQRRWNETVALLARQRAAMLVLGDFVTAELMTAGLKAGDDFLCAMAPGSRAVMLYALDSFILLNVDEPYLQAGQQLLVDTVLNPQVQAAFSTRKGGIPVRYGVKADDMDSCTAERYRVWSQPETRKLQPPDSSSRLRLALLEQAVQHIWLEIGSVEQALEHLLHQLDD